MTQGQEKIARNSAKEETATTPSNSHKIDRTAPAGSENSLGAESVRDGRPATDDSVVEAKDEEGSGIDPADLAGS